MEDSDLWLRTRGCGYRTLFDPALVVYHRVPPGRLTIAFCMKRAFSDGFSAYHRGEVSAGLRPALSFVLAQPFRLAVRALRGGERPRAIELVWPVRQAGLVAAWAVSKCAAPAASARDAAKAVPGILSTLWTILREAALLGLAWSFLKAGVLRAPSAGDGYAPRGNGRGSTIK